MQNSIERLLRNYIGGVELFSMTHNTLNRPEIVKLTDIVEYYLNFYASRTPEGIFSTSTYVKYALQRFESEGIIFAHKMEGVSQQNRFYTTIELITVNQKEKDLKLTTTQMYWHEADWDREYLALSEKDYYNE